jgi:hypothetical protein
MVNTDWQIRRMFNEVLLTVDVTQRRMKPEYKWRMKGTGRGNFRSTAPVFIGQIQKHPSGGRVGNPTGTRTRHCRNTCMKRQRSFYSEELHTLNATRLFCLIKTLPTFSQNVSGQPSLCCS